MNRPLSLVLTLGLAAPVLAQTSPATDEAAAPAVAAEESQKPSVTRAPAATPTGFTIRRMDFGISDVGLDTHSSRFREYRALPTGVVLPFVRFAGDGNFFYDILGENVLQKDAHYRVLAEPGSIGITAEYVKIPHAFGNGARSLLDETSEGVFQMSDALQNNLQTVITGQFAKSPAGINFAFLNALVTPSLDDAATTDLALLREQGRLEVRLTRDKPYDVRVTYFHEKRRGDRAAGTAFGFSNVVETPEPIDYRTQDYGLSAEWTRSWGLLRGGFHYNQFSNAIQTETFDNPFRSIDSTDPSAYTAPGAGSIGGARIGRVSLPPDNKSVTGSLGFLVKFRGHSRFSTDASVSQWTQDEPFMAMTTNSAIKVPEQGLPGSLDGKIKVFSLSSALTSRPVDHLNLAARFRRYDLSNDTPRVRFPEGYVRFDAVFEEIPRITVPYGYTTDALTLSASYDFGSVTVEGGYKLDVWDRTFREAEKTTQNVGYLKADLRAADWLVFRGTAEKGSRGYDGLEIALSEEASFLEAGVPANLLAVPAHSADPAIQKVFASLGCAGGVPCNLRYDQAEKDLERYGAHLELSPGGSATITFSYIKGKDDYAQTSYGLVTSDNESITGEVDYTPTDRLNVFGYYTRENISTFQRGRQSAGTLSSRTIDDWTSAIEDKVDSFGGGTTVGVVKEKVDLKLFANYQKVDGNNDIFSAPGGLPAVARVTTGGIADIPFFDDTKIYTLSGDLAYHVTKGWTLGLGGFYEEYKLRDSNTNDATGGVRLTNYVPGSFFLAADDNDYKGHVLYVRASYAW